MSYGTVIPNKYHFKIECKPIPKIVAAIKELPERRFDFSNKIWTVPLQYKDEVERFAKRYNLTFGHVYVNEVEQDFTIDPLPELDLEIPLKRELRPYQEGGVAYSMNRQRLIIGDDMGLGKTTQAIVTIAGLSIQKKASFPCLIICPSAVKENWKREIEKVTNYKALVLTDSIKSTFTEYFRVGMVQFFITNYESLKKYFVERIDDPGVDRNGRKKPLRINHIHFKQKYLDFFKAVIIDESHKVKDIKTKNCKFTKGIANGKETIICLTGTPVVNKPKDLVSQLGILDRLSDFGGYKHFEARYCSGPSEASNLKELNYMLNKICFYRRNKTDPEIKKYLPDKSRQVVMCELSTESRKEYNFAQANLESYMREVRQRSDDEIEKSMKGEIMVRIGVLKNISARGKLKDAFEFIADVIESGQKIVVFASLKEVIAAVQQRFTRSVRITGAEDSTQKQASVDAFRNNKNIDLIVLNLKAGGTGVDGLQSVATQVCFIEFGWHAAIMDQAEDRLYRMGQHSNVMCTYFLGKDTIDEWNYKLINEKRNIANTITGNEDETETSFIDGVMNLFDNKNSKLVSYE